MIRKEEDGIHRFGRRLPSVHSVEARHIKDHQKSSSVTDLSIKFQSLTCSCGNLNPLALLSSRPFKTAKGLIISDV